MFFYSLFDDLDIDEKTYITKYYINVVGRYMRKTAYLEQRLERKKSAKTLLEISNTDIFKNLAGKL